MFFGIMSVRRHLTAAISDVARTVDFNDNIGV